MIILNDFDYEYRLYNLDKLTFKSNHNFIVKLMGSTCCHK